MLCDMDTNGGGWTLVYQQDARAVNSDCGFGDAQEVAYVAGGEHGEVSANPGVYML